MLKLRKHIVDRQQLKPDPQVLRQLPRILNRPQRRVLLGIPTPTTFSAPSASTAIAATSAESIPPLNPTSTLLNPHFRT